MLSRQIGKTDENKKIKVTIHLRRRPDHDPIPAFESYIGCPARPRLSVDEFAQRYGAHQDEIDAVVDHYQPQGLTILSTHAARREVKVEGQVRHFNKAFGITLHDHQKGAHIYHKPDRAAVVPTHLSDVIVHVGLGHDPKDRADTVGGFTNMPPNAPIGATDTFVPPLTYMNLAGWPTGGGAGQTIAVIIFVNPAQYSLSDVQATCSHWGISAPSIIDVSVDGTPINNTTGNGEWNMDICCAWGFGQGAQIAVYFAVNSATDTYSRIIHPDPGDPICNITTESGAYYDEATLYVLQPSLAEALHLLYEDAAIQGVTICLPTGDAGSGATQGDGKDHACSNIDPYILAVGGTVFGINPFVEWLANVGAVSQPSYMSGGGGGVSIYVPLPSYQANSNVPPSTNSHTIGRGIPDVSTVYVGQFTIFVDGAQTGGGGTSQSCPIMAGLIASINAAVGRPVGFINPTLYANTSLVRDINPGNSVGGPQTNSNGYVFLDNPSGVAPGNNIPVPGYQLKTGWDPCVGLGVLRGNTFINFLTANNLPVPLTYRRMLEIDNTIASYWGGNVLDGCQITPVFWGSGWTTQSNPTMSDIITAINAIINAGYFDALNEYYVFNRPTVLPALIDPTSSASATPGNLAPLVSNLVSNLDNAVLTVPTADNQLFLYLCSDQTPTANNGVNNWVDYNNINVPVAVVFNQSPGINNWTQMIIRELVGAITGSGNGYPTAWNVFTSSPYVLAGIGYGVIGQTQLATWGGPNIGTSGGYSVPGCYSNLLRATIIQGAP